jgi:hypothetical protein
MKPAGQDPESVDCAQGPHSNALLAAEIQSFLDHLIAGFRQSRASNDARIRPRTWEVAPSVSTWVCLKGRKWSACGERTCAGYRNGGHLVEGLKTSHPFSTFEMKAEVLPLNC